MKSKKIFINALDILRTYYRNSWFDLRIAAINLNYLFTVVQLNNGQIGVAMNYANAGFRKSKIPHNSSLDVQGLLESSDKVHLLIDVLLNNTGDANALNFSRQSVLCAIFSALSRPFYSADHLESNGFKIRAGSINMDDVGCYNDAVSIIGFGGYMGQSLYSKKYSKVFIADLLYSLPDGKRLIDAEIKKFEIFPKNKQVIIHDGSENKKFIEKSSVVCITGSALCNDTMLDLLVAAQSCRTVIVSGHSGLLPPSVYFDYGVTHIGWSTMPVNFMANLKDYDESESFDCFIDKTLKPRCHMQK